MRDVDRLLRATARAELDHFWFRGFRWFVTPLIRRATEGVSSARILDCGCGTGANLALLGRYGVASGFDLSATGLSIGRELGRTRLARGSVAAAPFKSESFDLVTSFDVPVLDRRLQRALRRRRDVPADAPGRLRAHQRRRHGSTARRSFGAEPRAAPVHATDLAGAGGRRRVRQSFASPTRTSRCSCRCSSSAPSSDCADCRPKPTPNRRSPRPRPPSMQP